MSEDVEGVEDGVDVVVDGRQLGGQVDQRPQLVRRDGAVGLAAQQEQRHVLLAPAERALLGRLCVFAGRFTLADVEAVCCAGDLPAAGALDLLSALLDKSLVGRDEAGGAVCYRLHETMREFARLRLREAGDQDTVERRRDDHYLTCCQVFGVEGRYRLVEWLAWTDLEIDNVRRAVGLASSLVWFWVTRATTEDVRCLDEPLARDPEPAAHPWAYLVRGFLAVLQADPAAGLPVLERGVAAASAAGRPDALAQSLAMASIAANMAGDRAASGRLLDEARTVADGLDGPGAAFMTYQARALNGMLDGDLAAVRSAAERGARLSREIGDLYSLDMMLMNQGFAALISRGLPEAERLFAEAPRIARRLDDRLAQCYLLGPLGCCAAASREPHLAARLLGAMENLRGEVGATVNAGMAPAFAEATTLAATALGPARFRSEFEAGRHLPRDTAAHLALRESAPPPPRPTPAPPSSPPAKPTSPACWPKASPTGRSAPASSSPNAPWRATSAASSPNWASPPAPR